MEQKKTLAMLCATAMALSSAAAVGTSAAENNISSLEQSSLDKDYLADGKYTLYAEMFKLDKYDYSMANNAIDHTVQLEVVNGEYYITVNFKGMAIFNQFGYLLNLGYFDSGYSFNKYGVPEGTVIPAEVLKSYDVIDQYNDSDHPYPELLRFKVVDNGNAEYIPLQVFVPIMEAINTGSGTQQVFMKIDWSTLEEVEPDHLSELDDSSSSDDTNSTDTSSAADSSSVEDSSSTSSVESSSVADSSSVPDDSSFQDNSDLDKDDLADGKYTLTAEMIKTDRKSKSMSNNAINHTVQLEVIDGEYFVTMQFKGLAIYNQFGYLKDLGYYDAGYTYNDYGIPQGTVIPAEVLSSYDVVDQYNDADNLYPEMLRFKLVDKASAEFVPLQVFVPIMEAIAEGTGTQDVLMQLDWSTLVKTDKDIEPETPDEQSPELDFTDEATGVKIHADKGVFPEDTTVNITAVDVEKAETEKAQGYKVEFTDADGNAVKPNGVYSLSMPVSASFASPAAYRITDGKRTLVNGTIEDGYYTVKAKEAGVFALVQAAEESNSDTESTTSSATSTTSSTSTTKNTTTTNTTTAAGGNTENPATGAAAGSVTLALAAAAMVVSKKRKD